MQYILPNPNEVKEGNLGTILPPSVQKVLPTKSALAPNSDLRAGSDTVAAPRAANRPKQVHDFTHKKIQ